MEVLDDLDIKKEPKIGLKDYVLLTIILMAVFSIAFWLNEKGYIRLTPLMASILGWILLGFVGLLEGRLVNRLVNSKVGLILNTIAIFVVGFYLAATMVDDWFRDIKNYEYGSILTGVLCGLSFAVVTLAWASVYRVWDRFFPNEEQDNL